MSMAVRRSSIIKNSACSRFPAAARLRSSHVFASRKIPSLTRSAVASRQRSLVCRADVNWDAFRSGLELGRQPIPKSLAVFPRVKQYDYLVVGSGIAGLSYALKVAEYGTVAIITKDYANEGCTQYAQGGVCAVMDQNDSVAEHVRDTMVAGGQLNNPQAVEVVCREGPARVLELVNLGAEFTRNQDGTLHLTKEGGHGNRRVVHADDLTGAEIERALLTMARTHKNVHFYEHHLAIDLVIDHHAGMPHCFGADVYDQRSESMCRFIGLSTMLASGGAGQLYPNTTNPHVATGDGIAMAYRAGTQVSNMEFIQFHPTALYKADPSPAEQTFLITEAVRGEGGMLFNQGGERFMTKYDERMELAPRDIVARCIHEQLKMRGDKYVLLDISHKPKDEVLHHFPNIAKKCATMGIDITQDPIPVVPAQHYTCGGVQTGLLGETSIQGLYACGEVACSGLHGANRLASNSLLEGLVFGERAVSPSVAHAEHALRNCGRQLHYAAASADFSGNCGARQLPCSVAEYVAAKRQDLRDTMWQNCGIVRRTSELHTALDHASSLQVEAEALLKKSGISTEIVELNNLATVAKIVTMCALQRHESRGGHYILDYPTTDESERRPSMVSLAPEPNLAEREFSRRLQSGGSGTAPAIQPKPTPVKKKKSTKPAPRDLLVRMRSLPQDK